MIDLALFAAATTLAVAGLAGIARAMPQHHERLGRQAPDPAARRRARVGGWLLLALALYPCVAGWGASIGFVLWVGLLTPGVLAVAGLLAWRDVRRRG